MRTHWVSGGVSKSHARLHARGEAQFWHCYFCAVKVRCVFCDPYGTAQPATRDHVVARAIGGANPLTNQVIACYTCNQRKGVMSEEEYRALLAAERDANGVTRYA